MRILDFHCHLLRDKKTHQYNVEETMADMKVNGIDQRVISSLEGESISKQNNEIIELVRIYPNQFIGCAVINPKEDQCIEEAKRICAFPEIEMIEFNSLEHGYYPDQWEDAVFGILNSISARKLTVKIFVGSGPRTMPQQWKKYLDAFPNLNFVFLHMGGKDFGYGSLPFALGYSNIYYESSEMCELPILHKILEEMPMNHIVFGSNFPIQFTECSKMIYDLFSMSDADRERFYFANAEYLLGRNQNHE